MSYITITPKMCQQCGINFLRRSDETSNYCQKCKKYEYVHNGNVEKMARKAPKDAIWDQLKETVQ